MVFNITIFAALAAYILAIIAVFWSLKEHAETMKKIEREIDEYEEFKLREKVNKND